MSDPTTLQTTGTIINFLNSFNRVDDDHDEPFLRIDPYKFFTIKFEFEGGGYSQNMMRLYEWLTKVRLKLTDVEAPFFLNRYVQRIEIPKLSVAEGEEVETIAGKIPTHKMTVNPDSNVLTLNVITTQESLHEDFFYPWIREVTFPFWPENYIGNPTPFSKAIISIDFGSHSEIEYVFYGCRPTSFSSREATHQPGGTVTRDIVFAFDFMGIRKKPFTEHHQLLRPPSSSMQDYDSFMDRFGGVQGPQTGQQTELQTEPTPPEDWKPPSSSMMDQQAFEERFKNVGPQSETTEDIPSDTTEDIFEEDDEGESYILKDGELTEVPKDSVGAVDLTDSGFGLRTVNVLPVESFGDLAGAAAGAAASNVVGDAAGAAIGNVVSEAVGSDVTATDVVNSTVATVGSFLGGSLSNSSSSNSTSQTVGAAVGSLIGQSAIPVPIVGSAVGTAVGGAVGNALGNLGKKFKL